MTMMLDDNDDDEAPVGFAVDRLDAGGAAMDVRDLQRELNTWRTRAGDLEKTLDAERGRLKAALQRAEAAERSAAHAWQCAAWR